MKSRLILFLPALSLCAFWGCSSVKPIETASAETQPVIVDPAPEPIPAHTSATADKPAAVPALLPKAKPANDDTNDAALQPQTAARHETVKTFATHNVPDITSSDTAAAAAGFKNHRQFIAAVHLSKNLGIPFDQIKTRMTGEHRMSLTDSLRDLRSDMSKNLAKAEAKKAEEQAKDDESRAKDEAKKAAAREKLAANHKS